MRGFGAGFFGSAGFSGTFGAGGVTGGVGGLGVGVGGFGVGVGGVTGLYVFVMLYPSTLAVYPSTALQ